eukprot:COSAG06_NODE_31121_length_526_cov_2.117096_1_plen_80_part_10
MNSWKSFTVGKGPVLLTFRHARTQRMLTVCAVGSSKLLAACTAAAQSSRRTRCVNLSAGPAVGHSPTEAEAEVLLLLLSR